MCIVVLEDDHPEREFLVEDLRKAFPEATIVETSCVSNFLSSLQGLPEEFVLVLEHHLPLMQMGTNEEEMNKEYANLVASFPWVESWNHQEAGERVIRHLRASGIGIPILIYTHSNANWIASDCIGDPKVGYLLKDGRNEWQRLKYAIFALYKRAEKE